MQGVFMKLFSRIIISLLLLALLLPGKAPAQQATSVDFPSSDGDYGSYDSDDFPTYDYSDDSYPGYSDDDSYPGYADDGAYQDFSADYPGEDYGETAEPEPEPTPAAPIVEPGPPIKLEEKKIRIGRIPYLNLREMMTQAVPLLRFLQKNTGAKEVRLVSKSSDYSSVIDALAKGNIDFAWVGPTAYVKRRDADKLMPVAKAKFGDHTSYRGVFIARDKGKVQGLEDLKGSSIGFVDPESASGYIYPLYLLRQLGINPHKHSKIYFLKNHENVIKMVLAGKIDAGVCLDESLNKLPAEQQKKLIILAKTTEIPSDVIVCRQDCPINLREKFLEALLKVDTRNLPGSPTFLAAADEDFSEVVAVVNYIESLKK